MYQKPYTCTEINVLLHFSDLRALILQYNNVRGPIFPEFQKHLFLTVLYYYHYQVPHSICMSLIGIWICQVYDCR